jgi:hypothetical protein
MRLFIYEQLYYTSEPEQLCPPLWIVAHNLILVEHSKEFKIEQFKSPTWQFNQWKILYFQNTNQFFALNQVTKQLFKNKQYQTLFPNPWACLVFHNKENNKNLENFTKIQTVVEKAMNPPGIKGVEVSLCDKQHGLDLFRVKYKDKYRYAFKNDSGLHTSNEFSCIFEEYKKMF